MAGGDYPKLEELLGVTKREPELPTDMAEASANARSWGVILKAAERRAMKKHNLQDRKAGDGGNDCPA